MIVGCDLAAPALEFGTCSDARTKNFMCQEGAMNSGWSPLGWRSTGML